MTTPAVVALKCKVDVSTVGRIDRGEILYYNKDTKQLLRNPAVFAKPPIAEYVAVVTAEAVTLYKGQNDEVSVPISVLGKTEVVLQRRNDVGQYTQKFGGSAFAGQKLYYKHVPLKSDNTAATGAGDIATSRVEITTDSASGADPLGVAVHSINARTNSVDVIVNFAA